MLQLAQNMLAIRDMRSLVVEFIRRDSLVLDSAPLNPRQELSSWGSRFIIYRYPKRLEIGISWRQILLSRYYLTKRQKKKVRYNNMTENPLQL